MTKKLPVFQNKGRVGIPIPTILEPELSSPQVKTYREGLDEGTAAGYKVGLKEGRTDGLKKGEAKGYEDGYRVGVGVSKKEAYLDGWRDGAIAISHQYVAAMENTLAKHDGYSDVAKWREDGKIPAWWLAAMLILWKPLGKLIKPPMHPKESAGENKTHASKGK